MKQNKLKALLCLALSVVVISSVLCACNQGTQQNDATTTTAAQSTPDVSEETTVPTTEEDLSTTFPEKTTQVIYPGLSKDTEGSYPYEIASYTTTYKTSEYARTENLKAATATVDDIMIPAGSVFSFNQTVGKRTFTGGFATATVIKDGEFVDGLGGGVCQVSSTIFECVLLANVEIVSRTNHTLTIGYVPLGGDATVQWNNKDFQFKNTLGCDVKLSMTCEDGKLTCTLYAKEDVDVGDVNVSITNSGGKYTLTRTVDGVVNYTTSSVYQTASH